MTTPLFPDKLYNGTFMVLNEKSSEDENREGIKMLEECARLGCVMSAEMLGFLYQAHASTIPYDYAVSAYWYAIAYEISKSEKHLETCIDVYKEFFKIKDASA